MEKHINSIEIQGETLTKTSTHRDYSHATVAVFQNGIEGLMVWHLTKAAADKFARTESSKNHFGSRPEGEKIARIEVRPVHNEVVLTGKDAKKAEAAEIALEAADNLDAEIDAHNTKVDDGRSPEGDGCKCGCGLQTGKSSYRPGHDARHVSSLRKAILGLDALDQPEALKIAADQLSEKLTAKLISQLAKHSK